MITIVISVLIGALVGCLSGLVPGLHPNLLAVLVAGFGFDAVLSAFFLCGLVGASVVVNCVPAFLIGVPGADEVMSVMPAHALVRRGLAVDAILLSVLGSLGGLLVALLLLWPLGWVLPNLADVIKSFVVFALVGILLFFVLRETDWVQKLRALFVVVAAGLLGVLVLNANVPEPLFVLLGGLFGIPGVVVTLRGGGLPLQGERSIVRRFVPDCCVAAIGGVFACVALVLLPATGPAQGAFLARPFARGAKGYLLLTGALGSADIIISFLSFVVLDRARSGVVAVVGSLVDVGGTSGLLGLVGAVVLGASIASVAVMLSLRFVVKLFSRISYEWLGVFVLVFLFVLAWFLSGWVGILVFVVASAIGILPLVWGVGRSHCMAVLLIPTVLRLL